MSAISLDDLMAELNGDDSKDAPEAEKVEETVTETPEPEKPVGDTPKEEDPLEGLLVGEDPQPQPEPVKPKRGRPKGSTNKKKTPAKAETTEASKTETVEETKVESEEAKAIEAATVPNNSADNAEATVVVNADASAEGEPKDIYILSEAQIFNGHVYRRGQKITFRKGDKFYNSQTDRNGDNWLDVVDDPEAQYAKFGRLIVQPDRWAGIPIGSTENISHPGLALALAAIAQAEHDRNGVPFN